MSDITQTRIFATEHSYPQPTRNHLSMHNREASKRKLARPTKASEVRFGIRLPSGNTVMGLTDSETAQQRKDELANIIAEREARKAKMIADVHAQMAETDSWAHKS